MDNNLPLLRGTNVHINQSGHSIIRDISVALYAGEIVGVIGPNGAGKSTLLKALAGITPPSAGTITRNDNSVGFLPQAEQPAWQMSVFAVVGLGLLPHNSSLWGGLNASQRAKIDAVLHQCELHHLADRPVGALSGGELRRVLVARVLVAQANVVIADEPIAALDMYHQLQVLNLLRASVQGSQLNCGAIMAIHDLNLAAQYCDRLLLLNDGQTVALDTPQAVITRQNMREVYRIDADIQWHSGRLLLSNLAAY